MIRLTPVRQELKLLLTRRKPTMRCHGQHHKKETLHLVEEEEEEEEQMIVHQGQDDPTTPFKCLKELNPEPKSLQI